MNKRKRKHFQTVRCLYERNSVAYKTCNRKFKRRRSSIFIRYCCASMRKSAETNAESTSNMHQRLRVDSRYFFIKMQSSVHLSQLECSEYFLTNRTGNLCYFTLIHHKTSRMNPAKLIAAILMLQVLTSCGNSTEADDMTDPANTATLVPVPSTIAKDSPKVQTVTTQPVIPITAKAARNPPHGQPGHRCDIAVGAPLDSKPSNQTVKASPQPVTIAQPPTQSVASGGGAGVNPAHGQPGHRCDIAVGAPLNSKPTQPTINANPQPTVTPASQTPKPFIDLKSDQSTKGGLNPSHGQPGHRCDIAVGAPLNSKPVQ